MTPAKLAKIRKKALIRRKLRVPTLRIAKRGLFLLAAFLALIHFALVTFFISLQGREAKILEEKKTVLEEEIGALETRTAKLGALKRVKGVAEKKLGMVKAGLPRHLSSPPLARQ